MTRLGYHKHLPAIRFFFQSCSSCIFSIVLIRENFTRCIFMHTEFFLHVTYYKIVAIKNLSKVNEIAVAPLGIQIDGFTYANSRFQNHNPYFLLDLNRKGVRFYSFLSKINGFRNPLLKN